MAHMVTNVGAYDLKGTMACFKVLSTCVLGT